MSAVTESTAEKAVLSWLEACVCGAFALGTLGADHHDPSYHDVVLE